MQNDSPAELVAIIRAARLAGDKRLERNARRELKEQFRISLSFDCEPEKFRGAVANV
jgi:hypothetical protein